MWFSYIFSFIFQLLLLLEEIKPAKESNLHNAMNIFSWVSISRSKERGSGGNVEELCGTGKEQPVSEAGGKGFILTQNQQMDLGEICGISEAQFLIT